MFDTAWYSTHSYRIFVVINMILCMLYGAVSLYGQVSHSKQTNLPIADSLVFEVGEEVSYDVIYTWGFLKIKAGKVCFQVQQTRQQQIDSIYHLRSTGVSLPRYDWIFQVRDTFESWVYMPDFKPLRYRRSTHEGDYHVNNSLVFEPPYIVSRRQNSHTPLQIDSIAYAADRFDLQTAVYFVRQIDFANITPQDTLSLHIIIDGQPYTMSVQNLGVETITLIDKKYDCYHLVTNVIEGSIFKANQKINIWLSADNRHIPIKVEAPIIIGRVKAVLVEDMMSN